MIPEQPPAIPDELVVEQAQVLGWRLDHTDPDGLRWWRWHRWDDYMAPVDEPALVHWLLLGGRIPAASLVLEYQI